MAHQIPCSTCAGTGDREVETFDAYERCFHVSGYVPFGCQDCGGSGKVDFDEDDYVSLTGEAA